MEDIEEKILSYPHLSVEEQREIEALVEKNPEWAPLLRDVRSIEGVSANVAADLPSDGLLATYVVVRHLHPKAVPESLQGVMTELEARIEESESLRRRVNAARRRLKDAEAAIDPVSHFEALTEHDLEAEREAEVSEAPNTEKNKAPRSPSVWALILDLPRLVRWGGAVALILVSVYGGLYGVSRATQSPLDRLAAVEVSNQVVESYADTDMRSATPQSGTASVDDQYLDGLSALQNARVSTLGLFPRYDAERLAQAHQHFGEVLDQVEPRSFLALEAHFYLGKIALAQGDLNTARGHFKTVVRDEGRRAGEAYEILKTLQQEYGTGTQ